ncbi:MAG: hypothetical protein OEZ36_12850, partial [Spirochaetota bacterium]|nr:hypothetical protein [Spirochaetota bacterium]
FPDMASTSLSGPTNVSAGSTYTYTITVDNAGTCGSGSFSVDFYASTNTTISVLDTFLGTATFSNIAAGGSSTQTVSLTMPSFIPTTGWVGYLIDPLDNVAESDEWNNDSVTDGVDMVGYTPPTSPGGSITVNGGYVMGTLVTGIDNTHSVSVAGGSNYTIYWDDLYSGSGTYTANILVSVYDSSGNYIIGGDDGYTIGWGFAPTVSDIYTVVVTGYLGDNGTYAIQVTSP